MHVHSNLILKSLDTGWPPSVSGAIVDWNLSIHLLLFIKEVQMINTVNSRPKAFEVFMSIQIYQSAYHDCRQLRTPTLPCTGFYADWWIWIDRHTSNAFGREFCTDHVEKAGLATSVSLLSWKDRALTQRRHGDITSGSAAGIFEIRN